MNKKDYDDCVRGRVRHLMNSEGYDEGSATDVARTECQDKAMKKDTEMKDKAGRVLNAQNAARLVNALSAIQSTMGEIETVLSGAGITLGGEDESEEGNAGMPVEEETDEEDEPEEKARLFTQEEAEYVILSPTVGKACANCRWFNSIPGSYNGGYSSYGACQIVEDYPEPITLTGLSNKWELREPYKPQPMEVVIVGDEKERAAQAKLATTYQAPSVLAKIWETIKRGLNAKPDYAPFELVDVGAGKVLWIADYSNNFEDHDGEILSEKGHDLFIWRLDKHLIPMPELWAWHIKGSRHGQADKVVHIGNFVTAVGHFDDTDDARAWQKFYAKRRGEIELSHGFLPNFQEFRDGVFNDFNTFEVSTLPPGAAANPYTQFEEVLNMALDDAKKAWLETALGKEKAAAKIAQLETLSEAVKGLGAKYKDFAKPKEETNGTGESVNPSESPVDKSGAALLLDLVDAQAALMDLATGAADKALAQDEAIAKLTTTIEKLSALETKIEALGKQIGEPPKRAATAPETELTPEAVKAIQDKAGGNEEYDPVFGDLKIKKGAKL